MPENTEIIIGDLFPQPATGSEVLVPVDLHSFPSAYPDYMKLKCKQHKRPDYPFHGHRHPGRAATPRKGKEARLSEVATFPK